MELPHLVVGGHAPLATERSNACRSGSGALEDEKRRLKKLPAEAMLDNAALKDTLGKKTTDVCGAAPSALRVCKKLARPINRAKDNKNAIATRFG